MLECSENQKLERGMHNRERLVETASAREEHKDRKPLSSPGKKRRKIQQAEAVNKILSKSNVVAWI